MKQKAYQTVKPKAEKKMIIKAKDLRKANKLHLEAQIKYPAIVQEDKRKKKPKYKNKEFEEE